MKYLYKAMENLGETSGNVVLGWHERVGRFGSARSSFSADYSRPPLHLLDDSPQKARRVRRNGMHRARHDRPETRLSSFGRRSVGVGAGASEEQDKDAQTTLDRFVAYVTSYGDSTISYDGRGLVRGNNGSATAKRSSATRIGCSAAYRTALPAQSTLPATRPSSLAFKPLPSSQALTLSPSTPPPFAIAAKSLSSA